jgi:hypothetical protein
MVQAVAPKPLLRRGPIQPSVAGRWTGRPMRRRLDQTGRSKLALSSCNICFTIPSSTRGRAGERRPRSWIEPFDPIDCNGSTSIRPPLFGESTFPTLIRNAKRPSLAQRQPRLLEVGERSLPQAFSKRKGRPGDFELCDSWSGTTGRINARGSLPGCAGTRDSRGVRSRCAHSRNCGRRC